MTVKLNTRKPTGKVAYPLLVVDGFEKTGKSSKALMLSSSKHVGRTFVCELGEPTADEYVALGEYEIIVHDGTYRSMMDQLRAACAVPMTDGKPNVIVFDSATALWDMLCVWTTERARDTKAGRKILAEDADAEVKPHGALYNDRAERFDTFVNLLRDWPGIAVVVCHGKEVTPFENGAPVANAKKEYKVDVREYLMKQANAAVRCEGAEEGWRTTLRFARSTPKLTDEGVAWAVNVPKDGLVLNAPNPIEHVVFDVLKAGREFQRSSAVNADTGIPVARAKQQLMDKFIASTASEENAKQEAASVWKKAELNGAEEISNEQWARVGALAAERITELIKEKAQNE